MIPLESKLQRIHPNQSFIERSSSSWKAEDLLRDGRNAVSEDWTGEQHRRR